ncbi:MAG TPA: SDR family NAD(P)-dependent oxidoreductase [Burkholderiaceae bacterium]|jgi:NAD(P)-dependent dehydrogenase (short-subunit alcohol dehydrogenase family)|nr:SDR family NAD(P)-dependent oxidoreductase [Burkholderiaceae bacterium]
MSENYPPALARGFLAIVTGASRGLGHAVAAQYLAAGAVVLGLSRGNASDLQAGPHGERFVQWAVDLAAPEGIAQRLGDWLTQAAARGRLPARVRLIHNAALLNAPAPLADGNGDDVALLARSLRAGLEAPVVLTAAFLRSTGQWSDCDRRVLFVSSGLGRHAMAGSAVYCAQKAGLDHLARALALEEDARPGGARIASVAPGVIDTDMQVQLRASDLVRFPDRVRFDDMHRNGALDSPATAAGKLIGVLERDDYGRKPVTDVRES